MKNLIIGILIVSLLTNIASAEVILTVTPVDAPFVVQGGTIDYRVTVTLTEPISDGSTWLDEVFSILDERVGWTYDFNPGDVRLDNNADESRESILTITVPETAPIGTYDHTVGANGTTEFDESMGIEGGMFTTTIVNTPVVPVPELSTTILTFGGLIGIVLISRRYKK